MKMTEKQLVTEVLSGAVSQATHPALFDDDVVYFAVRKLEVSEAQWLQNQLSQATSADGRACVLSIMGKH